MADSVTPTDKDEDREKTFDELRTALNENQASYCKDIASYSSKDSSKPSNEHHCILGPYFFNEIPKAVHVALLRAHENEKRILGRGDSLTISAKLKQQWPLSNEPMWPEWVARVESSAYAYHWKRAGIYDAIGMSTCNMPFDHPLVTAGLCFWNSATNTMDFPGLGMMSPTLLDVAAITGFKLYGKEVSALTIPPPQILKLNGVDMSYSKFIQRFMGKENQQVTMEEHIAFLLYWLCKYIFCVASMKITEEWAGLAEVLASFDNRLELGTIVLAHLYRGLREMTRQPLTGNTSGPIWLFQMWLQLYFPELAPPHVRYHQNKILGASLVGVTLPEHTPEQCFNVFYQCTSRTDDQWSVCLNRSYPTFLCRFRPSNSKSGSYEAEHRRNSLLYRSFRAYILTTRDLNLGVEVGSKTYCGAELYCPNHFSRQLGCLQYIPVPVLSSVNRYSSWRKQFKEASEVQELFDNSDCILRKFKNQPYTMTYKSSINFKTWWEHKMTITCLEFKHKFGDYSNSPNRDARLHSTSQHPSSSGSILPSKRTRSNEVPVIVVNDEENEKSLATDYKRQRTNKKIQDIPDIPPGFGQATSTATPSSVSNSPLSVQENTNASFSQQLNDIEDFVKFKTKIQDLMNSRSLPSMEITVLQDQLSDVESHLPKFIASKEDLVGADKNLKRWLNLLPGATFKLETVDHRCSELDDEVKQLDSTLADYETKIAQVRLQLAQKVAELKTGREMRPPIQQIVDKINQYEEMKKQLESDMGRIREMYDLLVKRALELV